MNCCEGPAQPALMSASKMKDYAIPVMVLVCSLSSCANHHAQPAGPRQLTSDQLRQLWAQQRMWRKTDPQSTALRARVYALQEQLLKRGGAAHQSSCWDDVFELKVIAPSKVQAGAPLSLQIELVNKTTTPLTLPVSPASVQVDLMSATGQVFPPVQAVRARKAGCVRPPVMLTVKPGRAATLPLPWRTESIPSWRRLPAGRYHLTVSMWIALSRDQIDAVGMKLKPRSHRRKLHGNTVPITLFVGDEFDGLACAMSIVRGKLKIGTPFTLTARLENRSKTRTIIISRNIGQSSLVAGWFRFREPRTGRVRPVPSRLSPRPVDDDWNPHYRRYEDFQRLEPGQAIEQSYRFSGKDWDQLRVFLVPGSVYEISYVYENLTGGFVKQGRVYHMHTWQGRIASRAVKLTIADRPKAPHYSDRANAMHE